MIDLWMLLVGIYLLIFGFVIGWGEGTETPREVILFVGFLWPLMIPVTINEELL